MVTAPDTPVRRRDLRVELLVAGWTTHPGFVARRGAGAAAVTFPALVLLVHHPDGIVLYDTGYTPRVSRAVSRGIDRIYGRLLPVHIPPGHSVVDQLAERGIAANQVTTIVLSHLHADHLGGLKDFPEAAVVVDPAAVAQMRSARGLGRLRRGWLPALLPDDLEQRLIDPASLPRDTRADLSPLAHGGDLLGDGSLVVVPLPGHCGEHLGLLVATSQGDLLALGDAVWDLRAVTHGEIPHPVVQLITKDWAGYQATIADLADLARRRPALIMLPSHDEAVVGRLQGMFRR